MSYERSPHYAATTRTLDVGLQTYMQGVFNTMALGLGLTGLTAWMVASVPPLFDLIFKTPLAFVAMLAPLGFIWFGFNQNSLIRNSAATLKTRFFIFSAVMGLSMAAILYVFTGASVARAFFITSATFAGMSIYGYTTKRDLSSLASFLVMGLMGILLASLVNIFLKSTAVHFMVSIIGVLVFTGLTAFEVQRLKETYTLGGGEANDKVAVMGALNLYMNFINLFQIILQFTGDRRN